MFRRRETIAHRAGGERDDRERERTRKRKNRAERQRLQPDRADRRIGEARQKSEIKKTDFRIEEIRQNAGSECGDEIIGAFDGLELLARAKSAPGEIEKIKAARRPDDRKRLIAGGEKRGETRSGKPRPDKRSGADAGGCGQPRARAAACRGSERERHVGPRRRIEDERAGEKQPE